jgi:hypothetical protein
LLPDQKNSWRTRLFNCIIYVVTSVGVTLLLNPIYWADPIPSVQAALQERSELLSSQIRGTEVKAPGQVLETPAERTAILLAHLYLTPPMISEIGNYDADLAGSAREYLEFPGHRLFRSYLGGGLILGATILGLILSIRGPLSGPPSTGEPGPQEADARESFGLRRWKALVLLYTILQAAFLIVFVPLPWQRYVIPMLPPICIWAAVGSDWIIKTSRFLFRSGRLPAKLAKIFTQLPPYRRVS